ncbi:MAG: ribose-5-phosphate isomerase RpiA [Bacteroidota bacterium]|nr:ribose-5-phosphate isomerase RpiA [Bacteroidota bacterium]MDP4214767.1 ribose-5-phosphate isomerase RpiA [Bacteroidota bacterium]MDP4245665.1 ribose-5-phosphate isomerase RpiA [Bacteroidota bacterium]MDP4255896.1 ribose-5-phosphate isomerase RpiA [Bacteroidota bacterium]MDP4256854.1 ribose-5-phosphate isomerase RpiA [Bacteroidota bacterium]
MEQPVANIKKIAADKAMSHIQDGMILGLGTGSTAYWAIRGVGELVKQGLQVRAVATSLQSEGLAREMNIPIVSFSDIDHIDLTIDGADEVDKELNLIKGGGGALLREKIVAAATHTYIIIVDETKLVDCLGKFPLPVEVVPFGWEMTQRKLISLGCTARRRMAEDNSIFLTDNNHYIIDCFFGRIPDPGSLDEAVNNIIGVMDNGLFVNMTDFVIAGFSDGSTKVIKKG